MKKTFNLAAMIKAKLKKNTAKKDLENDLIAGGSPAAIAGDSEKEVNAILSQIEKLQIDDKENLAILKSRAFELIGFDDQLFDFFHRNLQEILQKQQNQQILIETKNQTEQQLEALLNNIRNIHNDAKVSDSDDEKKLAEESINHLTIIATEIIGNDESRKLQFAKDMQNIFDEQFKEENVSSAKNFKSNARNINKFFTNVDQKIGTHMVVSLEQEYQALEEKIKKYETAHTTLLNNKIKLRGNESIVADEKIKKLENKIDRLTHEQGVITSHLKQLESNLKKPDEQKPEIKPGQSFRL